MSAVHNGENYMTPQELFEKYPYVKNLGWSAAQIGNYFSGSLLEGRRSGRERKALIKESSFFALLQFARTVWQSQYGNDPLEGEISKPQ